MKDATRGASLALNLIAIAAFSLMTTIVFATARTQVKLAVVNVRQTQAQAIAEAGLEDALNQLYKDNGWRTGFANKAFGTGSYTVTLTTGTPPTIASTGYSESIAFTGAAVKTVTITALYVSTETPTRGVTVGKMLTLAGTGSIDAYDPEVSLIPSTGSFIAGVEILSYASGAGQRGIDTSGSTCPPSVIKGNVILNTTANNTPGASCVSGIIGSTTTTKALVTTQCADYNCTVTNDNASVAAYMASGNYSVPNSSTATIYAGTYYFHQISVGNNSVLNVDTSTGVVRIFYDVKFQEGSNCQVNNLSRVPANLVIADMGSGAKVDLSCTKPLHAYLEGLTNEFEIHTGAEVYGHIVSDKLTIDTGGKMHYDLGEGVSYDHMSWTVGSSGSWQESFKRQ
jgi:hypothetical protein